MLEITIKVNWRRLFLLHQIQISGALWTLSYFVWSAVLSEPVQSWTQDEIVCVCICIFHLRVLSYSSNSEITNVTSSLSKTLNISAIQTKCFKVLLLMQTCFTSISHVETGLSGENQLSFDVLIQRSDVRGCQSILSQIDPGSQMKKYININK